jgi:hypothetical protein
MELIVKTEAEAMTIDYDIETDGLYLQGIETKEQEIVLNLWSVQDFPIDTMATFVGVTPERTRQIILNALQSKGLSETEANQAIAIHEEKFNPPMKE